MIYYLTKTTSFKNILFKEKLNKWKKQGEIYLEKI
tara:strand:- start:451 stop:555 length:105 start_codon:yes stop_codon:yes gene_type:complete